MGMEWFSPEIDQHDYVESKVREVLEASGAEINDLTDELHSSLEWKLDDSHVTAMLQHANDVFSNKSYAESIRELWAGYILPLQAKLKSLWHYRDKINGMYQGKNSATYNAVKAFQDNRNTQHPNDQITADGWAGKETVQKLLQTTISIPTIPEVVVEAKKLEILPKDLALSPVTNLNRLSPFWINSLTSPSWWSYYTREGKLWIYYVAGDSKIHYINNNGEQVLASIDWDQEKRERVQSDPNKQPTDIETNNPTPTLADIITNPFKLLQEYKTGEMVEYANVQKDISWVVMQMFNMGWRTESTVLDSYERYKDSINKFPVLSAYILYRSMEWFGTYEDVVETVIEENKNNIQEVFDTFGVVKGEDLVDRLIDDFWGYPSLPSSRQKLDEIVQIIWNSDITNDTKKLIAAKEVFNIEHSVSYKNIKTLIAQWDPDWFKEQKYKNIV